MSAPLINILSVNPGAASKLPPTDYSGQGPLYSGQHPLARHTAHITSRSGHHVWRANTAKLILRIVTGLLFISLGILQMAFPVWILGLQEHSRTFGTAIIILAGSAILGIGGRVPALGLTAFAVMALITSSPYGTPATLIPTLRLQLTFIYGAIAAIMAICGPGRFTVPHLVSTPSRSDSAKNTTRSNII